MKKRVIFPNLEAEQARVGITDSELALHLKISRITLLNKKRNGNFYLSEIISIMNLFNKDFSYIFERKGA